MRLNQLLRLYCIKWDDFIVKVPEREMMGRVSLVMCGM